MILLRVNPHSTISRVLQNGHSPTCRSVFVTDLNLKFATKAGWSGEYGHSDRNETRRPFPSPELQSQRKSVKQG